MLNLELLIYTLLRNGLDQSITLAPELDVDSIDAFPLVTFTVTGGSAVQGSSSPPTAWDVGLLLNIFHDDLAEASQIASDVYDLVWSWDDVFGGTGIADGIGHAGEVDDQELFNRAGTVHIDSRSVTQYSGSFNMQLHDA